MAERDGTSERGVDFAPDQDKIFCANCTHCKLVRVSADNGSQYYLRVRCDAGQWRKKLGDE